MPDCGRLPLPVSVREEAAQQAGHAADGHWISERCHPAGKGDLSTILQLRRIAKNGLQVHVVLKVGGLPLVYAIAHANLWDVLESGFRYLARYRIGRIVRNIEPDNGHGKEISLD